MTHSSPHLQRWAGFLLSGAELIVLIGDAPEQMLR